ncbi:DsbA family protein [Lentilactobacillus rapi]|uniref:DsbA family protein n=1 Tax=Lentilactobacillus rapi TaxID=481723 RepID=UPI000ABF6800|nr:DsbA family protein [Lentilactobacillus rapi]
MLEIYLFIDPLNRHCYDAEKVINKISQQLKSNVSVRFLSMLNLKILNDLTPKHDANVLDHDLPFKMILDTKAASFQGKRYGREFLMDLQHEILDNSADYCDDLVLELAEKKWLGL